MKRETPVTPEDAGKRLDRWFKDHYPDLPFGALRKMMRKGEIRLDGKRVKGNERLAPGQMVRVPPIGDAPQQKVPIRVSDKDRQEVRNWILHEDDALVVLNKPAGLATQGGTGQARHLDGLLDALRTGDGPRPRLVHRLDKDTSGALLVAKTPDAAQVLARSFQTKETDKRYWALVVGQPDQREGRITVRMDKAATGNQERMVVRAEGKLSITDYELMDHAGSSASWLTLKPHTGRTHQLRLHCAEMGCPIVGDGKYGGKDAFLTGSISRKLHLHSRFVTFPHPSGGVLTITAPLPQHMLDSFDSLGFAVGDYEDPFENDAQ